MLVEKMRGLSYCGLSAIAFILCALTVYASNLDIKKRHSEIDSRSQLPTKTILGTCAEYNFKHPHCCSPPDCEFMVSWVDTGDGFVSFTLIADISDNTSVWAALGFSDNNKMSDTDVIACWAPDPLVHPQVHDGWIKPGDRFYTEDDRLLNELAFKPINATLENGKLICSFSRQKSLDSNESLTQDKPLTHPVHILVASGRLINETTPDTLRYKMAVHTKKGVSTCKCNVTDCEKTCACVSGIKYLLLKLHGVIMTIAFVFFLPTGALISRYYKIVFADSWFRGHVALMVFGVLFGLTGFGLILGHTGGEFTVGFHQVVGVVCLSLSVVQPLVGCIRPSVGTTVRRKLFNIFHRILAAVILTLGTVTLFLGAYIFSSSKIIWMMATLGLSVITNLGFMLLLEFLTRTQKFSNAVVPPVGYHKVTKHDELSESEEEVFVRDLPSKLMAKNSPGKGLLKSKPEPYRFEQGLLILFIIQSFSFAALFSALIYFYDSMRHM